MDKLNIVIISKIGYSCLGGFIRTSFQFELPEQFKPFKPEEHYKLLEQYIEETYQKKTVYNGVSSGTIYLTEV